MQLLLNPQFNFGLAFVCLILCLTLLVFPKYNEFKKLQANLQQINNELYGNNEKGDFLGLAGQLKKQENEYSESKSNLDKLNAEKQISLDFIFPAEENINFLTQLLEDYAIDHDSAKDPFELNSLSFGKAQKPIAQIAKPGSKAQKPTPVGYELIQINLPIRASEKNFIEFIKFIQNSGSLEEENFYGGEFPVPLMTIESLSFNYEDETDPVMVNANFILNTYLRLNTQKKDVSPTE